MSDSEKRPIGGDFEQNGYESEPKNGGENLNGGNGYTNGNLNGEEFFGEQNQNSNGGNYFGNDFSNGSGNGYSQNGYGGYNPNFNGYNYGNDFIDPKDEKKGLGIASMILGIISVVCCCLDGYPLVCAVIAIVFSALRMKVKADGFSIAGLVLGIIGVLFNGSVLLLYVTGVLDQIAYEMEQLESVLELIGALIRK
ncbi:MAG: DUF4190 domain-containing protein [Clostridiales bacterium]|nr:DUF4190 domain-containing protein [Clostridiales bacterium]